MKGGGIVFLAIFVFFVICFIWGIASIIGNARDAIQSKRTKPKDDYPDRTIPSLAAERMPKSSASATSQNNAPPSEFDVYHKMAHTLDKSAADFYAIAHTLEHLKALDKLYKDGALTDDEFKDLKNKIIQN